MTKKAKVLAIMLIVMVIAYIQMPKKQANLPNENKTYTQEQENYFKAIDKALDKVSGYTNIKINPTESYNYKTKDEVLNTRKKYVDSSIFATENYTPSEEVYGQIEDGKPWYGLKYYHCAENAKGTSAVTLGDSEESRFVNNPAYLIGVDCGVYEVSDYSAYKNMPFCVDKKYVPYPISITYNPNKKIITATVTASGRQYCTLLDTNARDMGYNFGYVSSKENVEFPNPNNVSNKLYQFQNYIFTNDSCKVAGGCNNSTPYTKETQINIKESTTAEMTYKLWHKRPKNLNETPDLTYKLIVKTY